MDRPRQYQPAEPLALGALPKYWANLEKLHDHVESLPPIALTRALSARKLDEAQPAGPRTYIAANRYLGVAMDNHYALRHLIQNYGATPSAPWSLLRPTFESGFRALWILDPADGIDRRRRGLRSEIRDARESDNHLRAFGAVPAMKKDVTVALKRRQDGMWKTFKVEADKLGVAWKLAGESINVVDEIPKLITVRALKDDAFGPWLVSIWRLLSGYEHGLAWAMMRGSDTKVHAEIPGGQEISVSINDDTFEGAATAAAYLTMTALRRFERLHSQIS